MRWSAVGTWVWVPTTSADAAVEVIGERLLLARRLGVDVDEDRVGDLAQRRRLERPVDDREGIVERVHEQPAHER